MTFAISAKKASVNGQLTMAGVMEVEGAKAWSTFCFLWFGSQEATSSDAGRFQVRPNDAAFSEVFADVWFVTDFIVESVS